MSFTDPFKGELPVLLWSYLNISFEHMLFFSVIMLVKAVTIYGKRGISNDKIDASVGKMLTRTGYAILVIIDIPHPVWDMHQQYIRTCDCWQTEEIDAELVFNTK